MNVPKPDLTKCCSPGKFIVRGEGPDSARVMLIGQNPGAEEERQGRPFVGSSGKYLASVLEKNGMNRDSLYITNIVKCRTPQNRKPTDEEIKSCLPVLVKEIKKVKPRLIVLLGKVALKTPRFEGIAYIETYHPAAASRFPRFRKKFEDDIASIKKSWF